MKLLIIIFVFFIVYVLFVTKRVKRRTRFIVQGHKPGMVCTMRNTSGHRVQTKTEPSFIMYTHPIKDDIHVSGSLLRDGIWERHFVLQFSKYLDDYPEAIVVDVGSNLGMYSLLAAKKGHTVYAFEPFQKNIHRQCNSILANNLTNLHLFPYALSYKTLRVNFQGPKENIGGTHTKEVENITGIENVDFARAYTIDSFKIPNNKPIIMKIDIEGSECEMMKGATNFFKRHNITIILMEWGQVSKKCKSIDQIIDTMHSKGLRVHDANGQSILSDKKRPWTNHWDVVWK